MLFKFKLKEIYHHPRLVREGILGNTFRLPWQADRSYLLDTRVERIRSVQNDTGNWHNPSDRTGPSLDANSIRAN